MRRQIQFGWRRSGRPGRVKRLVAVTSAVAIAVAYCRAAHRDEERGYPFTAAFEWRKAAELLGRFTPLASHCWHEWERIMCLPRHMATLAFADEPRTEAASQSRSV